jgi:tRNA threonylcarbamoyladenosine biosynthesis protein TsaE
MQPCHFRLETQSAAQTRAFGAALARLLCAFPGAIVALTGDLGAGKTTFTQGLAQGLGITAPVTSPTFVLINRYVGAGGRTLHHADCYRLSNAAAEMWDVGLLDLFAGDDVVVVEWADRIPGLFPEEYLEIAFTYVDEDRRQICLTAHGARYAAMPAQLASEAGEAMGLRCC